MTSLDRGCQQRLRCAPFPPHPFRTVPLPMAPGRARRAEYMGNTFACAGEKECDGLTGMFGCRLAFGFPVEGWNLKVIFWLLDVKQTDSCHN
jgi:hypothetical protein